MDNTNFNVKENEAVLSVKNLSKSFGIKQVLNDVSFDVKKGEIFGLLGPNGSGKTTTIKLALGLLNIQSGSVKICGYDVCTEFEKAVSNVGAIIENPEMYGYLTGRQNLDHYARMYDSCSNETIKWAIESVGLGARIDDKVCKYSLGMRQRLGIAQALLHSPKILILDEPTNGLDPEGIKNFREFLIELAHNKGISILISSHLLSELDCLCDRVAVINSGRIVGIKTIDEIRNYGNDEFIDYKIKVANIDIAIDYFASNEIKYKKLSDTEIKVRINEASIKDIVIALATNGAEIKAFTPIEKKLEDVFIELINKSGGSRI